MNSYEVIGRQVEEIENLKLQVSELATVIRTLKEGKRTLEDITVTEEGVQWAAVKSDEPVVMNRHQRRAEAKA